MMRATLLFMALLAAVSQTGWEPDGAAHKLVLRGKSEHTGAMAFSPDGRRFAAADGKEIVIWDTENARELMRLRAVNVIKRVRDGVTALAFNADGTLIASGNYNGVLKVWDTATGKERLSIKAQDPVIALGFDADNKSLISISGPDLWAVPTYEINVRDLSTGKETRTIRGQGASFGFQGLSLSPNGRLVAAVSFSEGLTIWDVTTGRKRYTFDEPIYGMPVFTPDSNSFATFVSGEAIIVWEAATGKAMRSLKLPSKDHYARGLAFSPDGKHLSAIVGRIGTLDHTPETSALHVWEVASGKEILRKEIKGRVGRSVFSRDGNRRALNNGEGYIRISTKPKARQ
jgi:WD40 repeat protein